MKNESYWQKTVNLPSFPKITSEAIYDVVIIGGGLSGISLAYRLNDQKLKVALLESDVLASKTTGHTTAKVTYLHGGIVGEIAQAYNQSKAKQYFESNYEAFKEIQDIIKSNHIDCDYMENRAFVGANDQKNAQKLNLQINLFKNWGIEIIENQLPGYDVSMGLAHQAIFHPLKYLAGLLKHCEHIDIFEHSLVTGSVIKDEMVVLDVNGIKVQAKQVVWMTRYPPNLQKGYFIRLLQEKEHVIYQEGQAASSILDLTTSFSKRYLDWQHLLMIKKINDEKEWYWYGQDTVPLRKIPYIGKINEHEYVAYGYNKWGMTLSHVASKLIYELLILGDSKYASLYAVNYGNYLKAGQDIIKLVKNNYHGMIKNRLVPMQKLKLKCNQGKVVRLHGRMLAVYKDDHGRLFYFSPYCPHLKCVVEFNEKDQTWNCPCHGSIFDCYGNLVNGPATKNLKQYKG